MSKIGMEYIKKHYNLPFLKQGMSVIANGRKGKITGTYNAHLIIKSIEAKYSGTYHPTWQMTYLDKDGKVLAEFKD
jgi:hypothetical protein